MQPTRGSKDINLSWALSLPYAENTLNSGKCQVNNLNLEASFQLRWSISNITWWHWGRGEVPAAEKDTPFPWFVYPTKLPSKRHLVFISLDFICGANTVPCWGVVWWEPTRILHLTRLFLAQIYSFWAWNDLLDDLFSQVKERRCVKMSVCWQLFPRFAHNTAEICNFISQINFTSRLKTQRTSKHSIATLDVAKSWGLVIRKLAEIRDEQLYVIFALALTALPYASLMLIYHLLIIYLLHGLLYIINCILFVQL